jgi:hypothetical protein
MVALTLRTGSGNARYRNLLPGPSDAVPTGDGLASILPEAAVLTAAIIRRGDSPETRRAYAGDLRTYARWLAIAKLDWNVATVDDLDHYREWLASTFARTTCNRRLSVVRALYSEAARRHVIADDPAARLRGSGDETSATVVPSRVDRPRRCWRASAATLRCHLVGSLRSAT